jgi:hypothetical protein
MSDYQMSPKRFVRHKLSGIKPEDFLEKHWEFLSAYSFLFPILEAYNEGDLPPTPTVIACQEALFTFLTEADLQAATRSIQKRLEAADEAPSGRYTISLYTKHYDRAGSCQIGVGLVEKAVGIKVRYPDGTEGVEPVGYEGEGVKLEKLTEISSAIWPAEDFGAACRKADRELVFRHDSVYAEVVNNEGTPITTKVLRTDAFARLLRTKSGPVGRRIGTSGGSLKWQPKAKPSRNTWALMKKR